MIIAIEAKPGQGKSVYLTYLLRRYHAQKYKVITNIKTTLPNVIHVLTWDEILQEIYKHCSEENMGRSKEGSLKVVLDELNIYLNSRNWEKLPIEVQLVLTQHRHYGVDIIGATQSVKRVDTIFRELVQVLYSLKRILVFTALGHTLGFFIIREYDPDDIEVDRREREPVGFLRPVFIDPGVFKLFSSWERLENNLNTEVQEVIRYKVCSYGHKHKI